MATIIFHSLTMFSVTLAVSELIRFGAFARAIIALAPFPQQWLALIVYIAFIVD